MKYLSIVLALILFSCDGNNKYSDFGDVLLDQDALGTWVISSQSILIFSNGAGSSQTYPYVPSIDGYKNATFLTIERDQLIHYAPYFSPAKNYSKSYDYKYINGALESDFKLANRGIIANSDNLTLSGRSSDDESNYTNWTTTYKRYTGTVPPQNW